MKAFVVVVCFVWAVSGAPANNEEILRIKKSSGAGLEFTSPCAGGAPLAPIALYLTAADASERHYRDTKHEEDNQNHARSYYSSPAAGIAAIGAGAHAAAGAAPAIGLFPNAHVGSCAIPLLLSCAPNVHSGHLAPAYSAPAYRADGKMAGDKPWASEKTAENQWVDGKMADDSHKQSAVEKEWAEEKITKEKQRAEENMIPEMQWAEEKAPEKQWESERAMELLPAEMETKPSPTRPFTSFEPELQL